VKAAQSVTPLTSNSLLLNTQGLEDEFPFGARPSGKGFKLKTFISHGFWDPKIFHKNQKTNITTETFRMVFLNRRYPASSKGCQINPKGWLIDTPLKPFGTLWKVQDIAYSFMVGCPQPVNVRDFQGVFMYYIVYSQFPKPRIGEPSSSVSCPRIGVGPYSNGPPTLSKLPKTLRIQTEPPGSKRIDGRNTI